MTERELHKIFSANIKRYRKALGLSQVLLAKKTNVSVNFVNDLETGKKWASPATMLKLAHAFKIEAYELLKPPNLLPDNLGSILKKYADEIHSSVDGARQSLLKEVEAGKK